MNDERYCVPVDVATDPEKGFGSVAADEWYDSKRLEEHGLFEDGHEYQVTETP